MGSEELKKVVILGNPNAGKSSLFNALTGLNQRIGNFPGVTVEKKTGRFKDAQNKQYELTDLPGTYSLFPKSLDEELAAGVITDPSNPDYPWLTLVVADASNLKRSLFLCTQVIDLKIPVILCLNMMDLAERNRISIDVAALSQRLGVPVIPTNARDGKGIEQLIEAISKHTPPSDQSTVDIEKIENKAIQDIRRVLQVNCDFASFIVANNLQNISFFQHNREKKEEIMRILELNNFDRKKLQALESIERYRSLSYLLSPVISRIPSGTSRTYKADQILTHKLWGFLIFLAVLFAVFQSIFAFAEWPMNLIENAFVYAGEQLSQRLPQGIFNDLLVNGVVAGLSGIVVFVPQLILMFAFIAMLEDTGYMARVSFIMDKLMRPFGLNGRSIIPLISGVACAVPAIMGSRTISHAKERLITLLVTPLMSCSARIPVYTLLVSLMVPSGARIGIFNLQGLLLMGFYIAGFVAALFLALVLKFVLHSTEKSYFVMELPVYRSPRWNNIGITVLGKVKVFLFDAGKVILGISIVLWFLSSYSLPGRMDAIEKKYIPHMQDPTAKDFSAWQTAMASEKLENSFAGILGKSIEPLIKPLGFDWKIGIALITSFAAREVFVGTMATIYSAEEDENHLTLKEKLRAQTNPESGKPTYSLAVCFSLMIFYAFSLQCMSTLAVVKNETGGFRWPVLQFFIMGIMAYASSFAAYQLLS
ncbi:MAG: ferrous iron transport protein B [Bacteroidota bacterium]|jgi:ferrous iron transport protein B